MAFLSKIGNILRQTTGKQLNLELSVSKPSLYQAIRCMSAKVFVGGISFATDEQTLRESFSKYGEVIEARVIADRETGRSRGFGFVTFTTSEEASSAIQALDGQDLHGRTVRVNYANDRPRTPGYGSGNYGGGGGYGGGPGYGAAGGAYGGGGSSYGNGGNFSSNFGGDNYSSGGNTGGGYGGNVGYGSGNSYAGGNTYDSGSGVGYGSGGNYGVAGGGGGSDNYVSGGGGGSDNCVSGGGGGADIGSSSSSSSFTGSGFDGNTVLGYGNDDQFASKESSSSQVDAAGGFNQDDSLEGNFRDEDDEPGDNYAKRA